MYRSGRGIVLAFAVAAGAVATVWGLVILLGANVQMETAVVLGAPMIMLVGATAIGIETTVLPDRVHALQSQAILDIAGDAMEHLHVGLTPKSAASICRLILENTHASAVSITDTEHVLGYCGVAAEHHVAGEPIQTAATHRALEANERCLVRGADRIECPDPTCPLTAAIVVPLQVDGEARGCLEFYFVRQRDLSRTAVALADGLARLLSMQLELDESRGELTYLAGHDPLTGLKNRRRFEEDLRRELREQARLGGSGALLWFDLDHFKDINDCLGHAAGDELLVAFAGLLKANTRGYQTLARLGGDEFGMLIPHADEAAAAKAASRLVDLLQANSFRVDGHEVRISASIGVVRYPDHGKTDDELMARADLAMYEAKATGGNQVVAYEHDDAWRSKMAEHIDLAERILEALREDRFVLYAQPQQRMSDGGVGSYELLLRMVTDEGHVVLPADIIPTAERLGLIRDIDRWVMTRAIRLLREAADLGHDVVFSVNLSGCAFTDPELLELVKRELSEHGVDPWRLIVEVTETTAIADITRARAFVVALKELGCRFSLDDFGSGTSSYYYLKHLPVDFLKLDGSLVTGLDRESPDTHFVRAIVEMCTGLSIDTVAEYVENEDLLKTVGASGLDYAQGYEVGMPMPVEIYLRGCTQHLPLAERAATAC